MVLVVNRSSLPGIGAVGWKWRSGYAKTLATGHALWMKANDAIRSDQISKTHQQLCNLLLSHRLFVLD